MKHLKCPSGFFSIRRLLSACLLLLVLAIVLAAFTPVLSKASLWTLRRVYTFDHQAVRLHPPRAIVIAGGGLIHAAGHERLSGSSLDRLRKGLEVHRRTGLPLLLTGYEAPLMRQWVKQQAKSLPDSQIWLETESRNSCENARFSARLLKARHIHGIYLVTDAWHLPRLRHALDTQGIAARASAVQAAPGEGMTPYRYMSLRGLYELAAALRDHTVGQTCRAQP